MPTNGAQRAAVRYIRLRARIYMEWESAMNYSPRGTRKAGRVNIGEPIRQSDIMYIRSAVQHCVQTWGRCFLLMFPDGVLMLKKTPPTDARYFVGSYSRRFSTGDIRADLYQSMADFGRPVAQCHENQQNQALATDAQDCASGQ